MIDYYNMSKKIKTRTRKIPYRCHVCGHSKRSHQKLDGSSRHVCRIIVGSLIGISVSCSCDGTKKTFKRLQKLKLI